jgi:uncharacterized membrane protein
MIINNGKMMIYNGIMMIYNSHMLHGAGIFTYITGRFLWQMLVNNPYMEHIGWDKDL